MSELIKTNQEKLITTSELAKMLNTSNKVILENSKKHLPNKLIQNGKTTYWNEEEVSIIIKNIDYNNSQAKQQLTAVNGSESSIITSDLAKMLNIQNSKELLGIKEVSNIIGVSYDVVKNCILRIFPDKINNGKKTLLNQIEITFILEELKKNKMVKSQITYEAGSKVDKASTSLTPALKIKQAMEMMQEAYEEELENLRLKNKQQQELIEQQAPKVDFYNTVVESKDWIDFAEAAKTLNVGIGRNKLFEILRSKQIINNKNQPYQKYQDKGYFRLIETSYMLPNGDCKIYLKSVVSQKGLNFILNLLK